MSMPRRAQCRLTAFGEGRFAFPFHRELIEALKESVPFRYRTYDPTKKEWLVESEYLDLAIDLLLEFFPDADIPRRPRPKTHGHEASADEAAFRALHLLPTAPAPLIEASYRVMARLNHPDVGGDAETMKRVNGAYAALKERVSV